MDATTTTLRLPAISDRHARGLRRDLFRELADHRARHRHVLDARLMMVAMPLRGVRERRNSYLRVARAIRDACFGFVMDDGFISGVLIEPCVLSHADGDEPALAMTTVLVGMGKLYWELTRIDAGRVSHHVVERMFQRLGTTSTAEVRDELALAFPGRGCCSWNWRSRWTRRGSSSFRSPPGVAPCWRAATRTPAASMPAPGCGAA